MIKVHIHTCTIQLKKEATSRKIHEIRYYLVNHNIHCVKSQIKNCRR